MNKKTLLGLIMFSCVVVSGMFLSTQVLIEQSSNTGSLHTQLTDVNRTEEKATNTESEEYVKRDTNAGIIVTEEPIKDVESTVVPTKKLEQSSETAKNYSGLGLGLDTDLSLNQVGKNQTSLPSKSDKEKTSGESTNQDSGSSIMASADTIFKPQLIFDHTKVNYKAHIPVMKLDDARKEALDIKNPKIDIQADAAILFDAKTKKVLYYKNPIKAEFPASTLKLLTAIVALENCDTKEEVTIGDEITMIASDSTRAYLKEGEKLTLDNLLEGMLLPSGNDAAYAVAAYVGRKTLKKPNATKEEAVSEFRRLMNAKAKKLGLKNSCFMTPDGYDAIGQYTTAYDMGLIGMEAIKFDKIVEISKKSRSSNTFISGEEVTWTSTNKLLKRNSGRFYSPAFGLKTGTSTLAGKCLISAAKKDKKEVVCVIMHSNSSGRYDDAIKLMNYGLK